MSFHRQRLRRLRRAACLDPMPSFYRPGERLPGDAESEYIEAPYFSPAALRWADEVHEYFAMGGTLPKEDMECLARVWQAMRAGRKPSRAQQEAFDARRKWTSALLRVPEIYGIEMKLRGVKNYGPDFELPDNVRGPGSAEELVYKYLFRELGYKTRKSAKSNHKAWKRANGTH